MLVLHVVSSVGLIGAVSCFLVLAIFGVTEGVPTLPVYPAMAILTRWLIVPLTGTALGLGIVQSLGTPWGLFRHYWITVKLFLTALAMTVLLIQTPRIDLLADASPQHLTHLWDQRYAMVVHAAGGIVVLFCAVLLSIYKPRGITRYGYRVMMSGRG